MDWYIGNEWKMKRKGLYKVVVDIDFIKLQKPDEVAKIVVVVETVKSENIGESKYLASDQIGQEQEMELGTAITPIDCYVELLVRQMVLGEKAHCIIERRSGPDIDFRMNLLKIFDSKEIFKMTPKEMYDLALRYKENGVAMFKKYPTFATDYFVRAAKCLISYKSFDNLTSKMDGISSDEMNALLILIQTNLSACLLQQNRFEDVIYHTEFVQLQIKDPSEKGSYRRAMAYYNLKEFEKAQQTIERVDKYKEKKEFVKLRQRIAESWKTSNDQYKAVVQKMFS